MPQVGFEPTIPVFERAKTVQALDRAATVIKSVNRLRSRSNSNPHRVSPKTTFLLSLYIPFSLFHLF
jgi:hypothetical protein